MARIEKPADTNEPVIILGEFKGLNNRLRPEAMQEGDMVEADNLYVDNAGKAVRRDGFAQVTNIPGAHSLWSNNSLALFCAGAGFYRLNEDYTYSQLGYGLTEGLRMSYVMINGVVYHSNGVQLAAYRDGAIHTWGLINPNAPLASTGTGVLPAGTYQYAVTFQRNDGFESGASQQMSVVLEDNQSINFTGIQVSANPDVTLVNIYLSPQNGDMLYYIASVPNGTTSYSYLSNGLDLKRPLRTQFKTRPVAGTDLAIYSGRIYVVRGDFVYYTQPHNYELMDLRDYLRFNGPVRIFAPVKDGIFAATDTETVFLRGKDVGSFTNEPVATYGGVAGTLTYDSINTERGVELIAHWESTDGKVRGMAGGVLVNMTNSRYTYAPGSKGASIVLEQGGTKQAVSVMQI